MPIPMSDFQKTINTPNAVGGKAANLSQEIRTAAAMAADFGNTIARGVYNIASGITQYKIEKQNSDDLLASNNAYNVYVQQMTDLNAIMQSKQGTDALAFKKDYMLQAQKFHSEVMGVMENTIRNPKIREDLRTKINAINERNRADSFLYFDRQEKSVKNAANNEMLDNLAAQAIPEFLSGANKGNSERLDSLFGQITNLIEANSELNGFNFVPENVPNATEINAGVAAMRQNAVAQKREQILKAIGEHLIQEDNQDTSEWSTAKSAIALMEYAREKGYVPDDWAAEMLNNYQNRALGVELLRNPDKYWDPVTGEYQYDKVAAKAKYLGPDDIIRAGKIISSSKQADATFDAQIAQFSDTLTEKAIIDDEIFRKRRHFYTKEEFENKMIGDRVLTDDEKKAEWKEYITRRREIAPSELVDHLITLKETMKTEAVFVPGVSGPVFLKDGTVLQKQEEGVNLSAEQIQEIETGVKLGAYKVYHPFMNSEYKKMIDNYDEQLSYHLSSLAEDNETRVVNKNKGTYKYKAKDAIVQVVYNIFKQEAKAAQEAGYGYVLDTGNMYKTIRIAYDNYRNGNSLNVPMEYANQQKKDTNGNPVFDRNGQPQYIYTFDGVNLENSFDGLSEDSRRAASVVILDALVKSISKSRVDKLANDNGAVKAIKRIAQQNTNTTSNVFNPYASEWQRDTEPFVMAGAGGIYDRSTVSTVNWFVPEYPLSANWKAALYYGFSEYGNMY